MTQQDDRDYIKEVKAFLASPTEWKPVSAPPEIHQAGTLAVQAIEVEGEKTEPPVEREYVTAIAEPVSKYFILALKSLRRIMGFKADIKVLDIENETFRVYITMRPEDKDKLKQTLLREGRSGLSQ